jgi:hypothetical protein
MESIEVLTEAYNTANNALKGSPLYAYKEAAGAALQAAHEALKAERVAARQAAYNARFTSATPAASIPDATGDVTALVLSHESGQL